MYNALCELLRELSSKCIILIFGRSEYDYNKVVEDAEDAEDAGSDVESVYSEILDSYSDDLIERVPGPSPS